MPTPTKGARMGGSPAHERLMLANLATALFEHGSITTTEHKARRLRPYAERLITKAKRGDLHARRQVAALIKDKYVVHVLFTEIGPRYENRHGGYTRITKIGPRKGDNAPMAVIELVEPLAEQTVAAAEAATKRAAKSATPAATPAAAPAAADSADATSSAGSSVDAAEAASAESVSEASEAAPAESVSEVSEAAPAESVSEASEAAPAESATDSAPAETAESEAAEPEAGEQKDA